MKTLIAVAALAAAFPATAQIPGVSLGQSVTETQAVIGNTSPIRRTTSPDALHILQDSRGVAFCDDKAVWIQNRSGTSVHDFAAQVREETARSGQPEFETDTGGGISTLTTRWYFRDHKLEIVLLQTPNIVGVSETVTARYSGCLPGRF